MKSRPTSPREFLKNASAKLDRPHSAKIANGRLLSVSSALFVLKVSSPFEQSFQHSAAEPQPKVAGASILDKMLTFGKNTTSWEERSAMKEFIARHAQGIAGVLSGFDRLVFRGTLRPISYPEGMMGYLS